MRGIEGSNQPPREPPAALNKEEEEDPTSATLNASEVNLLILVPHSCPLPSYLHFGGMGVLVVILLEIIPWTLIQIQMKILIKMGNYSKSMLWIYSSLVEDLLRITITGNTSKYIYVVQNWSAKCFLTFEKYYLCKKWSKKQMTRDILENGMAGLKLDFEWAKMNGTVKLYRYQIYDINEILQYICSTLLFQ